MKKRKKRGPDKQPRLRHGVKARLLAGRELLKIRESLQSRMNLLKRDLSDVDRAIQLITREGPEGAEITKMGSR